MQQIIFDFGGVLVEWDSQKIVQKFTTDIEIQQKLQKQIFQHADWLELDSGLITEQEAAIQIAGRTGLSADVIRQVFDTVRLMLIPMEQTVSLLQKLVDKGIPCYGLTNMSVENYEYLRQTYPFFDLFAGIVVSGYEKCIKPDRKIFNLICERYKLEPKETFFIDDSIANIESAHAMGLQVLHFNNKDSCVEKTLEILVG